MRFTEFRRRVREAFGPDLEHATPQNVRDFVAKTREEVFPSPKREDRWVIDSPTGERDYEGVMLSYFADTLAMSPDRAAIGLWLYAFEMWFAELELSYEDRFAEMWGPIDEAEQ